MATITYSHNSSVQAKSATSNQASAMSDLAQYTAAAAQNKQNAYSLLENSGTPNSITFNGTIAGTKLVLNADGEIKIKTFKYTENTTDLHENIGITDPNSIEDSYADNRYSYTYIPYINKTGDGTYIGEIRIFVKNSTKEYFWGYRKADGSIVTISKIG